MPLLRYFAPENKGFRFLGIFDSERPKNTLSYSVRSSILCYEFPFTPEISLCLIFSSPYCLIMLSLEILVTNMECKGITPKFVKENYLVYIYIYILVGVWGGVVVKALRY